MEGEMLRRIDQPIADEWITFPGGELEGRRPKALCPTCRIPKSQHPRHSVLDTRGGNGPSSTPLCFQCYRTELERQRALKAAGELDTASEERFQTTLPFEPVNRPRLEMLKAERAVSRTAMAQGINRFADRRRQAQINARHALQRLAAGLDARTVTLVAKVETDRLWAGVVHAAELQLPESWLPFVVSR